MKKTKLVVVPQSFEVLPDDLGLPQRIELCGRTCYKSEDKTTDTSATGFCRVMVNHKHNSVLEMGVVTYAVQATVQDYFQLLKTQPKFLVVDYVGGTGGGVSFLIVTGSIRAFREMFIQHPSCEITNAIVADIHQQHPYFFEDLTPPQNGISCDVSVSKRSLACVDSFSAEHQARHRFVAVRFITNRAVTHEIVRHRPCAFLQESQRYCRYSEGKFGGRVTFIKPMFFEKGSSEYEIWEEQMLASEGAYLDLLKTSTPQAARTVLPNSCKTELIVYASLEQWHHIFHMRAINKEAEPSMREIMIPVHEEFKKRFPTQNFGEPRRMPEGWVK